MSASERTPLASAFFDPSAERARRLDERMRRRLADSVRYVARQAAGQLDPSPELLAGFFARLEQGPVSPHSFAAYYDLVLALDEDDLEEAGERFHEMLSAPPPADELRIVSLGEIRDERDADRLRRHVDTDPDLPLAILPPPPELAAAARSLIEAALALLRSAHPALAAEIAALVREIVLVTGPADPKALRFDGASSFMLWGTMLLNASVLQTKLEMVQRIAHESGHNLLFGLASDGPLVENDDQERFASPLRVDPRPIDGIYHATFVSARMHQAVARLLEAGALAGAEREEAERALAQNAANFARGLQVLDRHARLTPMGSAALAGARAYMERAVPTQAAGGSPA